jgi:hypothetical protein
VIAVSIISFYIFNFWGVIIILVFLAFISLIFLKKEELPMIKDTGPMSG